MMNTKTFKYTFERTCTCKYTICFQGLKSQISQLHVRIQECIKALIAVTSRLDAVVACENVLDPMEN